MTAERSSQRLDSLMSDESGDDEVQDPKECSVNSPILYSNRDKED